MLGNPNLGAPPKPTSMFFTLDVHPVHQAGMCHLHPWPCQHRDEWSHDRYLTLHYPPLTFSLSVTFSRSLSRPYSFPLLLTPLFLLLTFFIVLPPTVTCSEWFVSSPIFNVLCSSSPPLSDAMMFWHTQTICTVCMHAADVPVTLDLGALTSHMQCVSSTQMFLFIWRWQCVGQWSLMMTGHIITNITVIQTMDTASTSTTPASEVLGFWGCLKMCCPNVNNQC